MGRARRKDEKDDDQENAEDEMSLHLKGFPGLPWEDKGCREDFLKKVDSSTCRGWEELTGHKILCAGLDLGES